MNVEKMEILLNIAIDIISRPLYNHLEVGFRHHPLTDKEKIERYQQSCDEAKEYLELVSRELK